MRRVAVVGCIAVAVLAVAVVLVVKLHRDPDRPATLPHSGPIPRYFDATVTQYRTDEGTNHVEVELVNVDKRPHTVRTVWLQWAGISAAPHSVADAAYAPGQTIDLNTTYGEPICRPRLWKQSGTAQMQ